MDVLDRYFGVHGAALAARSKRLDILASNIANAATPNYKARDIDFSAELNAAQNGGPLIATSANHIATAAVGPGSNAMYRVPVQPSLDGNTVELSTEQTLFAENAVQYQTTLSFLNGRISTLMSAIRGE